MESKWAIATVLLLAPATGNAATITGKLVDLTPALQAGVHTIQVQLKSDQPFGISGAGFNIISSASGNTNFVGGAAATSFSTNLFTAGYSTIKPLLLDATHYTNYSGQPNPAQFPLSDGDFDAIGGSFIAAPQNVDPQTAAFGQSGSFEVLATENWNFTASDTLQLYLVGPQYFSDNTGNNRTDFDTVIIAGVIVVPVPEPSSIVLVAVGTLCLLAAGRRRSSILQPIQPGFEYSG